jgi:hypothetical protein
MKASTCLAALALVSVVAAAQEETEFPEWMEAASQNVGRLSLSLQDKDAAEATAAAKELQEVFVKIAQFFQEKNASGAATYASEARKGFEQVEELIQTGNLQAAYQVMQATRSNCDSCHQEHRERGADGRYRIKY